MTPAVGQVEGLLGLLEPGVSSVVLLTGAGISAESGIPTFRGEEGYWTVGSVHYHPQELATAAAFRRMPDEVWAWYLYRRAVCRGATPNAAHEACARLEERLGDRFVLITQNVDGLHLRAGNTSARTYQIHGNLDLMRCARECSTRPCPIPVEIDVAWAKGRAVGDAERRHLRCPRCAQRSRPHVLWFDECYDEERFRFDSSLRAASAADLLIVIGTAGQTNLPLQVGALVARRGVPMIVVGPEPSPFTAFADASPRGLFLQGAAGALLPPLLAQVAERLR